MTNVNGVGYSQTVVPANVKNASAQQVSQYSKNPYPNDAFVYSKAAQKSEQKKSSGFITKLLLTAAIVVGGSVAARKYLPALKNYTKVAEPVALKDKAMNLVVTIADKTTELARKGYNKVKDLISKDVIHSGSKTQILALPTPEQAAATQRKCKGFVKSNELITMGKNNLNTLEAFEATTNGVTDAINKMK